jgi:hypothetical protein
MSKGHVRAEICLVPWDDNGTSRNINSFWPILREINIKRFSAVLKVHKNENFFGSEFEFYTISLLFMLKY